MSQAEFMRFGSYIELIWPTDVLPVPDLNMLNNFWISPFTLGINKAGSWTLAATVLLEKTISFSIPGIDSVEIVVAPGGSDTLLELEIDIDPFEVRLVDVPIVLRIRSDLLKPAKQLAGSSQPRYEVDPAKKHVDITLAKVTLSVDGEGNIELKNTGTGIELPHSIIGDTGIAIYAKGLSFHFGNTPPPGKDAGWRGIYFEKAEVFLPASMDLGSALSTVRFEKCYIGNGGFSGRVTAGSGLLSPQLNTTGDDFIGPGHGELFGMKFALKDFTIEFKQNALTESTLNGWVILPYFEKPLQVDIGLDLKGTLTVEVSATQPPEFNTSSAAGLIVIEKRGICKLTVKSLKFEYSAAEGFLLRLGGKLRPTALGLDWPEFDVKELTIDNRGKVKVEGGWLDLPEAKKLDFYGFTLELTKLGFGTDEDAKEQWIGFNGSVNLPLPAGASVEGLRIIWDPTQLGTAGYLPKVELNGVGVHMAVPGAFSFEGKVAFFEDKDRGSKGFRGDIKLALEAVKCMVDGKLIIGQSLRGEYTFFYIFLDADLPVGIPLFSTGASIYGFQGLLAVNMEPNRKPEEAWYEGWYKRHPIGATDTSKWWDVRDSMAFGVGVSIGTATDDGFSVNTKTLLILVLPGPIILLEGKGNFIKQRPATKEVTAEGAFTALLVLDGRQRIFQMNLDASYNLVKVIDVHAGAEAFFDFDRPWAWHLFLGQKEPEEKRIQAKILDLFGANAYWMMWKDRLELGAWYGYKGGPWTFGPLSAAFEAWMSGEGLISRNPEHYEALIQLYGLLQLRAFGAGIDINVDAGAQGRGPTPWEFDAWVRGALRINLLLKTIELAAEVHLHWEELLEPQPVTPVLGMAAEHLKTDEAWEIPFVESTDPSVPVPSAQVIIPPDARPVITFTRPVHDDMRFGPGVLRDPNAEVIRPGLYEFRYYLGKVELLRKVGSSWQAISKAAMLTVTGVIGAQDIRNNNDGTSTVTLSSVLPGAANAFAGGTFSVGNEKFTVISNSDRAIDVLNKRPDDAPEVRPSPGSFELKSPEGPDVYGQWLPTDQAEPSAKTKLQLWTKTPYTYFRRNDPSVIPPVPFDVCGPDVKEEPICVGFDALPPGDLSPGKYQVDDIVFDAIFNPPFTKISVVDLQGRKVLNLNSEGGVARTEFTFQPPLDMIQVYGVGHLKVSVTYLNKDGTTITPPPANIVPTPVDRPSSVKFVPDTANGQTVTSLAVEAQGEKEGSVTRLCFLPGWTCVSIPRGAVPPNATNVDVAGIKFSGKSEAATALERISEHAAALESMLPGLMAMPESQPFLGELNRLLMLCPQVRTLASGIAGSLPATVEALTQLGVMLQVVRDIRARLAVARPTRPTPTVPTVSVPPTPISPRVPTLPTPPSVPTVPAPPDAISRVIQLLDEILSFEPSLVLESYLTIQFPRPVTRARVALRGRIGTDLKVEAYGGTTKFTETSVMADAAAVEAVLDVVRLGEGWIDRLEISGLDPTVEKVCYDGPKFAWERQQQFFRRQQWRQQLEYWYSEDMVLEPDMEYCIKVTTAITNREQELAQYKRYWYGFFKTGYPPLGREKDKTTYPGGGVLADLSAYVFRTVPEDGAGEEGKRPPYRGYDVGMEFNVNYVDRLYHQAARPLGMRILDNNGRPVAEIANYWGETPERWLSEGERRWEAQLNLSDSMRCGKVNWSEVPGDAMLLAGGEGMTLQPETLHRAELVAKDPSDTSKFHIVHSFEFTTSKFVNFIHHMHSFEDRVWEIDGSVPANLADLFNQASNAVGPKVKEVQDKRKDLKDKADKVIGSGAQPTEDDFKAYDDALKQVSGAWVAIEAETAKWFLQIAQTFGLTRPNAARALEISVIKSANGRHALLLESPEPIDWRRTKLELRRSPTLPAASVSPSMKPGSTVKISGAGLPTPTDLNYWVELLARDETALDGYKLEIAQDGTGQLSFNDYFAFPQGTLQRVGKRLRIGTTPAGQREAGVEYKDPTYRKRRRHTPLTTNMTWIRLLDNSGQCVHQQVVQPEANYSPSTGFVLDPFLGVVGTTTVLLLPNADGTRALLLLKDGTSVGIPDGAYALTFEFRRDVGPEAPILREAGRTIPELVTVRFLLK